MNKLFLPVFIVFVVKICQEFTDTSSLTHKKIQVNIFQFIAVSAFGIFKETEDSLLEAAFLCCPVHGPFTNCVEASLICRKTLSPTNQPVYNFSDFPQGTGRKQCKEEKGEGINLHPSRFVP